MDDNEVVRPDLSAREFELFRRLIREESGIELSDSHVDTLRISLSARTGTKHLKSYLEYYDLLQQNPQGEEFKELLNLITTNETFFFRMPAHFAALREHILPEILETKKDNKLSIWSAGCSTGEEPYSIAITLKEFFKENQGWDMRILGTDVSRNALHAAEEGVYGGRTLRMVDPEHLGKYFEPQENQRYKLKDEVRNMVCFGYHNLIKEPFPALVMSNWDIIFCRNVIIYFSVESAKRVVDNFYESLREDGYLFVSYAEMLQPICNPFLPVEFGGAFVYKKKGVDEPAQNESPRTYVHGTLSEIREVELMHFSPPCPSIENLDKNIDVLQFEEYSLKRAELFVEEEQYALALAILEKCLKEDPRHIEALLLRGLVSANLKNYEQAEKDCLRVIGLNRMVAPAHFLLGVAYENLGKSEKAVGEFRKTLYLDRDFALAYLNIANIYRRQGRNDDALRELRNAAAAARRSPQGEWLKYAGGFQTEAIVSTAEKLAGRLEESRNT